ncbi:MAG: RidA family protein, partial [Mesorhizobium sp.]
MTFSELKKRPESTPYDRLLALGITLPEAPPP